MTESKNENDHFDLDHFDQHPKANTKSIQKEWFFCNLVEEDMFKNEFSF